MNRSRALARPGGVTVIGPGRRRHPGPAPLEHGRQVAAQAGGWHRQCRPYEGSASRLRPCADGGHRPWQPQLHRTTSRGASTPCISVTSAAASSGGERSQKLVQSSGWKPLHWTLRRHWQPGRPLLGVLLALLAPSIDDVGHEIPPVRAQPLMLFTAGVVVERMAFVFAAALPGSIAQTGIELCRPDRWRCQA
jgi:hypothetical protein